MAYIDQDDIHQAYLDATSDADIWRKDYPEYERLMDNGLLEDLDENLPEVNDGSLAASLFKLAKRVIRKKMAGRAEALDTKDAWLTELANIQWTNNILPNAKSKASPRRKWKDAARKAAGYGSQPIITLFVERGNYTGADFIVPLATDVKLESGKDSDADSDIIFWDVYFTKTQLKTIIEQAKEDMKNTEGMEPGEYDEWDIAELEDIVKANPVDNRAGNEEHKERLENGVSKKGIHFYIAWQRGVQAPFYMYHCSRKKPVHKWSNPDPTGDIPCHYLYCYQDFINPYGIGIVKLAGGTQNVLDYMRQADVLATQIGIRPPKKISGDTEGLDIDSLTYTEDADWIVGSADVERLEMANGVYSELPGRISMYQTSLQKIIPMGDTSASGADSGDSMQSKTPAGVKLQAASLSIDDEDFMENVDETYEDVVSSMINIHFANMQGSDLMQLSTDEREILEKAGLQFPLDENGKPTEELEIEWDKARASFRFKINAEEDKATDEATQLEGLTKAAEIISNPNLQLLMKSGQPIILGTKKIDVGQLIGEMIALSSNNDKIVTDVSEEEAAANEEQQALAAQGGVDPEIAAEDIPLQQGEELLPPGAEEEPIDPNQLMLPEGGEMPMDEQPIQEGQPLSEEEAAANVQFVMQKYGVDQNTAVFILTAAEQGFEEEEILDAVQRNMQQGVQV